MSLQVKEEPTLVVMVLTLAAAVALVALAVGTK